MNQEKIGKFIAQSRKKRKMTQQELADKLGVSDRTIGNWENGRNMPDLSLFKPLCNELDITINDLLSGEKISEEDYREKLEENIVNTIDYTNKKIVQKNNMLGIILLAFGFLIVLTAMTIFPSESSWGSIYSVFGTIIALIGFSRFTNKLSHGKRLFLNYAFFILFINILFGLDFLNVKLNNQAPRFSTYKTTIDKTILYDTPFYDVYRCNTDLDNEYWVIEKNTKYSDQSIMVYCKEHNM